MVTAAAGFTASLSEQTIIVVAKSFLAAPMTVNVSTLPLPDTAALVPIPAVSALNLHAGDSFATQIAALAVIVRESPAIKTSVMPMVNVIAVGVLPARRLPLTTGGLAQTSELVVVKPLNPAIGTMDFVDTLLNVTVDAVIGLGDIPPMQVITEFPALIPAAPA